TPHPRIEVLVKALDSRGSDGRTRLAMAEVECEAEEGRTPSCDGEEDAGQVAGGNSRFLLLCTRHPCAAGRLARERRDGNRSGMVRADIEHGEDAPLDEVGHSFGRYRCGLCPVDAPAPSGGYRYGED